MEARKVVLAFLFAAVSFPVWAQEQIVCPTPGEACRVLLLTDNEIQILTQANGILDTAAKARSLDLGALVTYFSTKIANAPAGKMLPKPEAKAAEPAAKPPEAAKK